MKPSIAVGGITTILTGETDAGTRARKLASTPGSAGAIVLRAVGPFTKRIVYAQWSDRAAAAAQKDGPPLETIDVRLKTDPGKRDSTVSLAADGHVALVCRWVVDPERFDALLAEQQGFTDYFLPKVRGVISTSFLVSADRCIMAEYLQAESVWAMLRMQVNPRLRRHISKVGRIAAASDSGLYRIEHIIPPQ